MIMLILYFIRGKRDINMDILKGPQGYGDLHRKSGPACSLSHSCLNIQQLDAPRMPLYCMPSHCCMMPYSCGLGTVAALDRGRRSSMLRSTAFRHLDFSCVRSLLYLLSSTEILPTQIITRFVFLGKTKRCSRPATRKATSRDLG